MIRTNKIKEANDAISKIRDIVKDLTDEEKDYLTEHSKEYRQMVEACRK